MKYASLTERIAGKSVDAWEVHYRAAARLQAGEDIILLSVGQETQESTPAPIVDAAIDSLRRGRHHYTEVAGTEPLRQAIADRHQRLTGQVVAGRNCAVFSGAQNALFAVAQCLLEPGDEVILVEPYYTTYPATVTASGASLVSVKVKAENRFQLEVSEIAKKISDRTRAIVLNSPNNPTGAVYTRAQLEGVVKLCLEHSIWLVNDAVYTEIIPPSERRSVASIPEASPVCVTVSSLSKSHRMTGWRLGWVVAPEELIGHLANLSMCMAYGLPTFIQDAATYALENDNVTADLVRDNMAERRRALVGGLEGVEGLQLFSAEGGMFVVIDIRDLGVDGQTFAMGLLERHNVALLPCDGFGESGRGLLRISLVVPKEQLVVAAGRIVEYVEFVTAQVNNNELAPGGALQ